MPLLVSLINLYSDLLAFETLLFLICNIYNLYDLKCDWLSQRVFDLVRHTRRSSFISLPHRQLVLSPSCRSMMRWEHAVVLFTITTANLTFSCPSAAYMNSYSPQFFLPACHFSLSASKTPFFPWCITPLCPLLLFRPFIKSLHLYLPQLSEMSALTMLTLLPISFPFTSFGPTSPLTSSSQSPVSSRCSGRLRSCNVSVCLNWNQLFLPCSCSLPPHYRIYLHPPFVPPSLCAFLSLLPV